MNVFLLIAKIYNVFLSSLVITLQLLIIYLSLYFVQFVDFGHYLLPPYYE